MITPGLSSRPFGRARSGLLLVCAGLLLAGTVEFHPAIEGLGEHAAWGDQQVFLCLDGHPTTLHVEAAVAAERVPCPACLYQLQTSGSDLAAVSSLTAPAPAGLPAEALGPPPLRRAVPLRGARGPPLS
jgi:hypothetical protein